MMLRLTILQIVDFVSFPVVQHSGIGAQVQFDSARHQKLKQTTVQHHVSVLTLEKRIRQTENRAFQQNYTR